MERERQGETGRERERDAEIEANLRDKATQRQSCKQKLKENRTRVLQRNGDEQEGGDKRKCHAQRPKRKWGPRASFRGDGKILELDPFDGCTTVYMKSCRTVCFTRLHFLEHGIISHLKT